MPSCQRRCQYHEHKPRGHGCALLFTGALYGHSCRPQLCRRAPFGHDAAVVLQGQVACEGNLLTWPAVIPFTQVNVGGPALILQKPHPAERPGLVPTPGTCMHAILPGPLRAGQGAGRHSVPGFELIAGIGEGDSHAGGPGLARKANPSARLCARALGPLHARHCKRENRMKLLLTSMAVVPCAACLLLPWLFLQPRTQ